MHLDLPIHLHDFCCIWDSVVSFTNRPLAAWASVYEDSGLNKFNLGLELGINLLLEQCKL